MHPPPGRQHAPSGRGQLAVLHPVPFPRNTPPSSPHRAAVIWAQNPLGRQHAPVGTGGGQFAAAHGVPFPRYTPPARRQFSWVVTAQLPLG